MSIICSLFSSKIVFIAFIAVCLFANVQCQGFDEKYLLETVTDIEIASLFSKQYPDQTKSTCMLAEFRKAKVVKKLNNLKEIVNDQEKLKGAIQPYILNGRK